MLGIGVVEDTCDRQSKCEADWVAAWAGRGLIREGVGLESAEVEGFVEVGEEIVVDDAYVGDPPSRLYVFRDALSSPPIPLDVSTQEEVRCVGCLNMSAC
jgi:hypothetical protein